MYFCTRVEKENTWRKKRQVCGLIVVAWMGGDLLAGYFKAVGKFGNLDVEFMLLSPRGGGDTNGGFELG